ncbi:predicted protein [Nematostella vectensis]|uniref:Cathepsin propeptide inhibitor domain-containing protein n=1 Tax=Nematostella vectensis TaxID=45351 RepID=A7TC64_NEMVE|nr:predicted protein [Nematostella vectensis]|eukprot:XP_001618474.1 hypothetical protein NEMVEDRAFT_v1g225096 [Nematostella vectensis]
MKTLSFLFVVMLLFMPESLTLRGSYDKSLEDRFREFVSAFNKSYVDDVYEYGIRKEIFLQSLIRHDKLNREEKELGGSARYGVNQFSDLTPEEFKDFLKRGYAKEPEMTSLVSLPSDVKCDIPGYKKLPSFWDWQERLNCFGQAAYFNYHVKGSKSHVLVLSLMGYNLPKFYLYFRNKKRNITKTMSPIYFSKHHMLTQVICFRNKKGKVTKIKNQGK